MGFAKPAEVEPILRSIDEARDEALNPSEPMTEEEVLAVWGSWKRVADRIGS
ncbi:MAG TPA: hypothetical protein VFH92_14520 [Phenylobacterium sp.]|nr:hypothetical protein [Phenylobacterium sp.]